MSPMRAATTGATTASASFSSAIGTPNLAIRVRAPANTINRCNSAGGKTPHAARRPHLAFRSRRNWADAHRGALAEGGPHGHHSRIKAKWGERHVRIVTPAFSEVHGISRR